MSLWGSGLRHKPSIGHLYGRAAKEAYHRGVANIKAPPGFKDAYYVEDAIDRYLGIENAFGQYSITGAVDSFAQMSDTNYIAADPMPWVSGEVAVTVTGGGSVQTWFNETGTVVGGVFPVLFDSWAAPFFLPGRRFF